MLIHGAWLTPAAWDLFRVRYEAQGYTVVAPAWPLQDRPIAELRQSPHPDLGRITIGTIVEHYAKLIRALPEPPIIVGHSFGGLFTQLLLDRGLGVAGVALAPAPIRGILARPRTILTALPVYLGVMGWSRVLTMSFRQFAANFAQTLPKREMRAAYDRHVVPAPGRIYYQNALGIGIGINARNRNRAPLLLIAGEMDRTIVDAMVWATYRKQRRAPSTTAFRSFPGRSHFLFAEPGWQEVADVALQWAGENARAPTTGMP
jgi:pimeloyl-ACP methyl ester carboxylesterase